MPAPAASKAMIANAIAAWRKAGVEKSAHGLRKALATSLAEGGATPHEIAAWTGHITLKEVERYTKAFGRRRAVMGIESRHTKIESQG